MFNMIKEQRIYIDNGEEKEKIRTLKNDGT